MESDVTFVTGVRLDAPLQTKMPAVPRRGQLSTRPSVGRKDDARKSLVGSCSRLLRHLEKRNDILLLTTSTRYRKHAWDVPKSTQLALRVRGHLLQQKKRVTLLDVAKLKIHTCEGNISGGRVPR